MNFFNSVFSDDPNPQYSDDDQQQEEEEEQQQLNPNPNPTSPAAQSAWSFGGLIKTLATKSESVIETYRRDLEEFGSGLKKETTVIREVASRVVNDLPGSLEIGASVAQDSLESLGEAIDGFGTTVWKETAEIISQGKETIFAAEEDADSSSDTNSNSRYQQFGDRGSESKPFSRFDSQLNAIRVSESTYCEEPEDLVDYSNWKLGFVIDEESEEIASLIDENGAMEGIYKKLVPSLIDADSFWYRYFYRVYKLKQAEDARAKLVNRVISGEEEEDLTWDFDEDEEEEKKEANVLASTTVELPSDKNSSVNKTDASGESSSHIEADDDVKTTVVEYVNIEKQTESEVALTEKDDISEEESNKVEEKGDNGDSCKNSDFSIISTQPSLPEEEDIGWDDIEDIGSGDETKVAVSGSPNRADLRKRLSVAEDDEDLTWDIEDDDEPVKP